MDTNNSEVELYISQFGGEVRSRLLELREIVLHEAPEAVEAFSYGLVGYKLNSRPLVFERAGGACVCAATGNAATTTRQALARTARYVVIDIG